MLPSPRRLQGKVSVGSDKNKHGLALDICGVIQHTTMQESKARIANTNIALQSSDVRTYSKCDRICHFRGIYSVFCIGHRSPSPKVRYTYRALEFML